jgi:hypothetical protein
MRTIKTIAVLLAIALVACNKSKNSRDPTPSNPSAILQGAPTLAGWPKWKHQEENSTIARAQNRIVSESLKILE